jgi:LEA14-like dessication related protein
MDRLLIIGIGLYLLLKNQLSRISYFPVGVNIVNIDIGAITIDLSLRIDNNSDVNINAKSFRGQLFYDNTPIGTVSIQNPVSIPAFSRSVVKFRMIAPTTGVVQSLVSYQPGRSLRLMGRLFFDRTSIPVRTSFQL